MLTDADWLQKSRVLTKADITRWENRARLEVGEQLKGSGKSCDWVGNLFHSVHSEHSAAEATATVCSFARLRGSTSCGRNSQIDTVVEVASLTPACCWYC